MITVISKRGARVLAAAAAGTLTFGLMVAGGEAAHADVAPTSSDVVGVGSDTLQYMLDFGADGDANGNAGNNSGKVDRLVSFDATADANARAAYQPGSNTLLSPTIVLRAGSSPVQRPNGSGAGISALINDKGTTHAIDYVRSSSPLSDAQVNLARADGGVGDLRVIKLATDGLAIAASNDTNAPVLSKQQLFDIYQCNNTARTWTQVGGTSSASIIPIVPQPGSGTRNTFLRDIGFTVGSGSATTPALGGCVKTAEENDPFATYITDAGAVATTANPNAIEPMSEGRLNLYNTGYFKDPTKAYGTGTTTLTPTVKLFTGTTKASDGNAMYDNDRPLFVIFRDSDVTSTKKYNGSTKNWAQTFFYVPAGTSGTPFFAGGKGQGLLASAGVVPAYANCGLNATSAAACN